MKPSREAFVVIDRGEGKKANWHKIGVVWENKNGGETLILESLPIGTNRVLLMPPKERSETTWTDRKRPAGSSYQYKSDADEGPPDEPF